MQLTIPLISKPSPRAYPSSSAPVIAARPVVTIASPKQLTASPSTPLLPLPTTLPSAAPISATLTPASTQPTGIPATLLLSVPLHPTFPRFHGMTLAPGLCSPLTWATAQPTAQRVFATIQSTAPSSRPPWAAVGVPANAPAAHRLPPVWSAAHARGGPSLLGSSSLAIPTPACATLRTVRSSLPMGSGATSTFSAGRTLRTAALPAAPIQLLGPARAAPLLLLPSWRAAAPRRP